MTNNTEALPPLPELQPTCTYKCEAWPECGCADQMRNYARAALAQQQQVPADLLREACAQIKHLIDDLTTREYDGPLVRYVPRANLMFSNLIGALLTLVPKMEAALTAAPPAQPSEPTQTRPRCTCLTGQLGPDYCEVHAA